MSPVTAPPAVRVGSTTPTPVDSSPAWVPRVAVHWAAASTCWPRPERARSIRATTAPEAADTAPKWYPWGTATRTGGRSSSPVTDRVAELAITLRSAAAHCALGPVWP